MLKQILKTIAVLVVGLVAMTTLGFVSAAPASAATTAPATSGRFGNCGRTTTSVESLLSQWTKSKVLTKMAARNGNAWGYQRANGPFKTFVRERVVVATLASSATVSNTVCNKGNVKGFGTKVLPKGHREFVVLPAKYAKSDISTVPVKGSVKIVITVTAFADTGCINGHARKVKVTIWIKKAPKPAPAPAPSPTPAIACSAGSTLVGGNCVNQTQTATETSKVDQACSAGTITNGNQCISYVSMTIVQINANCSQVYYGSGGTVVYEQNILCSVVNTPPAPPVPTIDVCPTIPGDQPVGYVCTSPPTFVNITFVNDVQVKWTTNVCTTAIFSSGSGSFIWATGYGSFTGPTTSTNVQSGTEVCNTYTAPTEVPAGGTDMVTVTATDAALATATAQKSTNSFRILAKPITPTRVLAVSGLI